LSNFFKSIKDVGRKIFGGERKKKETENSIIKPLQGKGATEKRLKNNAIKPLSIISVPCMKIQGGPRLPAADAHEKYINHTPK